MLNLCLDLYLKRVLEKGTELESTSGGGSNLRLDLGYVGGMGRELIAGRNRDLETFFFIGPRVIARLGIKNMESRFNLLPVENPGHYHL